MVVVFAVGCGGAGSSGDLSGGDGAAAADSTAEGSSSGSDAIAAMDSPTQQASDAGDGGASTLDASDGASSMQDASSDAPLPACPDVHGAYAIMAVDATGCGASFNTSAPECISQSACGITFQSSGSGGANRATNGDAMLDSSGAFSGAALKEGDVNRTGCTGSWNAANSTMTVDCGGTGSSQSCVLAFQRTSVACN